MFHIALIPKVVSLLRFFLAALFQAYYLSMERQNLVHDHHLHCFRRRHSYILYFTTLFKTTLYMSHIL